MLVEGRVLWQLLIEGDLAILDDFELLDALAQLADSTVDGVDLLLLGFLGPHLVGQILALLVHQHFHLSLGLLDEHVDLLDTHLIKIFFCVAGLSAAGARAARSARATRLRSQFASGETGEALHSGLRANTRAALFLSAGLELHLHHEGVTDGGSVLATSIRDSIVVHRAVSEVDGLLLWE